MATAQEIIRGFMNALDETELVRMEALGEAARKSTGYGSWEKVVEAMYKDCRDYGAEVFLRDGCGIILDNADTGAITGSDAGGGPVKTAESVVPEKGNDWRLPEGSSTTYGEYGLTVDWPNLSSLSDSQRQIVAGLHTWWIPESLRLIRDSYGLTFNEGGTTVNRISQVVFEYENSSTLASVSYRTRNGQATELTLNINMRHYENMSGDINGKGGSSFYLDRVIAHEMTHAVMAANIKNFSSLPSNIKEGAAELVHGIDDERRSEIRYLSQNPDKLKEMLLDKYLTGTYEYAAGYMLLRYFAKQAAAGRYEGGKGGQSWGGTGVTDTTVRKLTVTTAGHYWLSGYDPLTGYTTTNYPDATEIDATGSDGDIILGGNGQNNLLKAGKGRSSLWGGGGSADTMKCNSARDMIWFGKGDGNDVAQDFTAGNGENSDVLNLYDGSLEYVNRSGNNLTLKMAGGGALSVRASAGADAVVLYSTDAVHIYGAKIGETNKANTIVYDNNVSFYQGGRSQDTLRAVGEENKIIWLDGSQGKCYDGIEVLDGSNSGSNDQLAGGYASETIKGGRGRSSLWGGAGGSADTLVSGSGDNQLFYGYGEGADVMTGTTANDRVMLYNIGLHQITGAEVKGNEIRISTTAGQTLTVSGQAGTFTLGDGSSWRPNRQNGSWQAV